MLYLIVGVVVLIILVPTFWLLHNHDERIKALEEKLEGVKKNPPAK